MLTEHNEYSLETIFSICHDLHKNGKTIGFTHGAFDLFHYGHLHLLRRSAENVDFLIVGVEQDINISSYKASQRPIIPETKRLEILNEIRCVNLSFVNRFPVKEDVYEAFCKNMKVDLLTHGSSHAYKDKLQSRAEKLKMELLEVDIVPTNSTTEIIQKIRT